jgi:hypothetical protein
MLPPTSVSQSHWEVVMDPLFALSMSMQANPGVYALLLGSGVSRSAGMPTGWEVVLDLLKKLAAVAGETPAPNPEAWYLKKFGAAPTYSGLLEAVAKSQAERSQLLRGYFEPTDEDREDGKKVPTAAHRAIAGLVKLRMVRVILTTNFDRLLENALEAEGINPIVIASGDDVEGALPLIHSQCTVVKIHGDYLDLRTRNTPVELGTYDDRLNSLLDRIFDEFGLIVCGWSAEWDAALCSAISRTKARRFTTYWTKHSALTDPAERLVSHRCAQLIEIKSADDFFDALGEKVRVLADVKGPHPLSTQAAIAQTKRYLPETKYPIRLHDLLMGEIQQVVDAVSSDRYPVQGQYSKEALAARIADFEGVASIAASIIATGCFWGTNEHYSLWTKALNQLCNVEIELSGLKVYVGLRRYPAVLMQYAAGVAAAASGKFCTIHSILTQPKLRNDLELNYVPMQLWEEVRQDWFKAIPALERMLLARSERIHTALREPLKPLIPGDAEYTEAFDLFETLQSLEAANRAQWALPGIFMYRYYTMRGGRPIARRDGSPLLALKEEARRLGTSPVGQASHVANLNAILKAGFCGGTLLNWEKAVQIVDERSSDFG